MIKGLILDMDGVLWRGDQAIGNLKSTMVKINSYGWLVIFATNNATRTAKQYVQALSSFGVTAEAQQIITSADAVIAYLRRVLPGGGPVYIVGEQGVIEACAENGYVHSAINSLAVIAGFDREFTYEKLKVATLLLHKGVPFIGTNPDRTFPTPEGLIPGAGAIIAALQTASGVPPVIVGKPEPTMYEVALQRLNLLPNQVLVVGDRPETDIAGAQAIGCRTALVLSGVTNEEQAKKWQPPPDIIAEDLESLVNMQWKGS